MKFELRQMRKQGGAIVKLLFNWRIVGGAGRDLSAAKTAVLGAHHIAALDMLQGHSHKCRVSGPHHTPMADR